MDQAMMMNLLASALARAASSSARPDAPVEETRRPWWKGRRPRATQASGSPSPGDSKPAR